LIHFYKRIVKSMGSIYPWLLGLVCLVVCSDDCDLLRRENELLRELVAVYRGQSVPQATPATTALKTGNVRVSQSPVWTTSLSESTFTTLVTVPVSTEVPLTLNGQLITTTIVDYETKETVSTTLIPTSSLVYQNVKSGISSERISSTAAPEEPIKPTKMKSFQNMKITPTKTLPASLKDRLKESAKQRENKRPTTRAGLSALRRKGPATNNNRFSKNSFTITKSKFPGFGGGGSKFSRFKRETFNQPTFEDIELQPSF